MVFEVVIGIIAGVMAGIRRNSFFDNLVLVSTTIIVSIPILVLAFVAQYVLAFKFGLFPIAGTNDGLYSYILPGLVLASGSLAYVARLTRTSLAENLRADYVRTARAKGLPRRTVIIRHTLRNSLIPVVTFIGADIGALLGGAIVDGVGVQPARYRPGGLRLGTRPGGRRRGRHRDVDGLLLHLLQPDRGRALRRPRPEDPL